MESQHCDNAQFVQILPRSGSDRHFPHSPKEISDESKRIHLRAAAHRSIHAAQSGGTSFHTRCSERRHIVPYTLLSATGILALAVPAAIALILNRYIVSGLLAGSVK
jgi:hypothetical protein